MSIRAAHVWLAVLLALPHLFARAAPAYTITPISGKYTWAVDMNNAGQVAVNNNAPEVPYHIGSIYAWPMNIDIPTPQGSDNFISGINNRGDAVGKFVSPGGAEAYAYSNGRLRDLSAAYGMHDASDINDRGDIAGQVGEQGALAGAGKSVEVFGPAGTHVAAINNLGAIAGDSIDPVYGMQAFAYSNHQFTRLGRLGGTYSSAAAINDAGAIVGSSTTDSGATHAFLYHDGVMMDLAPWSRTGRANDINNDGQIVGALDGRAFLYANGTISDLNTLIAPNSGWLLVSADDINDRHQILASACDTTGTYCYGTLRLDPIPLVPEPDSLAMLVAGAALLYVHGILRSVSVPTEA